MKAKLEDFLKAAGKGELSEWVIWYPPEDHGVIPWILYHHDGESSGFLAFDPRSRAVKFFRLEKIIIAGKVQITILLQHCNLRYTLSRKGTMSVLYPMEEEAIYLSEFVSDEHNWSVWLAYGSFRQNPPYNLLVISPLSLVTVKLHVPVKPEVALEIELEVELEVGSAIALEIEPEVKLEVGPEIEAWVFPPFDLDSIKGYMGYGEGDPFGIVLR